VSVVLNDRRDSPIQVSEETRQRIIKAAKELGYAPNPAAQMLAQGKNQLLALFNYGENAFPVDRDHPFYAYMIGIEREAVREDYNLLLITRGQGSEPRSIYGTGINMLRLADGALIMGWRSDGSELKRLTAEGYPFVYIGKREIPGCQIDWVGSDYREAGIKATNHLLALGHRHLGLICVGPDSEEIRDRKRGCREALQQVPAAELTELAQEVLEDADALGNALAENQITALICGGVTSLRLATGLLQELFLSVPDDLSLCTLAFDEGRLWPFHALHPTYIRHQDDLAGELAVQMLVKKLGESQARVGSKQIGVELVVGNTTKPLEGPR
jgi:DNA-binding LacI/PurR family transcriptional regulator